MSAYRLTPRLHVVNFFAHAVTAPTGDTPCPANDNTCPHCGGVLGPGDKASDCSGSGAWPMIPFPKGWEASC